MTVNPSHQKDCHVKEREKCNDACYEYQKQDQVLAAVLSFAEAYHAGVEGGKQENEGGVDDRVMSQAGLEGLDCDGEDSKKAH